MGLSSSAVERSEYREAVVEAVSRGICVGLAWALPLIVLGIACFA
ncbi:MAG TPA: hypothetical protein VFE82_09090 [Ramlibacter sp.]|jgi:hypothetical protein|nr:hypothetical protein [Ramlibacter sp.]HZY18625.1 hypothetical protein [Ramlibacter sp.]